MDSAVLRSAAVVDAIYTNLPLNISPTTLSALEEIRSEVNPDAPQWPELLKRDFVMLSEMREEIEYKEKILEDLQKKYDFLGRDASQLRTLELELSILQVLQKDTKEKLDFTRESRYAANEEALQSLVNSSSLNVKALQARRQRRAIERATEDLAARLADLRNTEEGLHTKYVRLQKAKDEENARKAELRQMYEIYNEFLQELENKLAGNSFTEENGMFGDAILNPQLNKYRRGAFEESELNFPSFATDWLLAREEEKDEARS